MPPLVSICVVTHDRPAALARALLSCTKQTYGNVEVLVVNNGGNSQSLGSAGVKGAVREINLDRNEGVPGGRNVAMRMANGEFFLHLDDDGFLHPEAVASSVQLAMEDENIAVVALRVVEGGCPRAPGLQSGDMLGSFSGGASLIRRAAIEECGCFDRTYWRQGEETDLAVRLYENHWRVVYCAAAIMYHRPEGASQITDQERMALGYRNRMATLVKYAPWWLLLPEGMRLVTSVMWRGSRRFGLAYAGHIVRRMLISSTRYWKSRCAKPSGWRAVMLLDRGRR